MIFTKPLRSKLQDTFGRKMFELSFDTERPVSTWSEYLSTIGCRRVAKNQSSKAPRGHLLIDDPIWHGDGILIPRDVAVRVLALGLP
jgi:hypothetical protein